MNYHILEDPAQQYINAHLNDDVHKIAMSKLSIEGVDSRELANQIAAKKKATKKLPTWFSIPLIYYPTSLSIEQTSSEITAQYKATLAKGDTLIDLTGGFGVDGYYFSKQVRDTTHCEINGELLEIAAYNAKILGQDQTIFINADGIQLLEEQETVYDTIYIDPVRRSTSGKVFMLKDCSPNVIEHHDLLLKRSRRLIIKTAPMLDITAGLKELKNVTQVHIVSTRNEVKELLWVLEEGCESVKIVAVTLNDRCKTFSFSKDEVHQAELLEQEPSGYLYEPDAALLKSGAFDLIAKRYGLKKLHQQTQLYTAPFLSAEFPGRIFLIKHIISPGDLKRTKDLQGNVIVRNYRDTPENLIKKHKIKASDRQFLIFTASKSLGFVVIDCEIIQHY